VSVELTRHGTGVVVARLEGEIDAANADATAAALARALDDEDTAMVVDLSDVAYIGSAGVRLLHELTRRLESEGRRLRLVVARAGIVARLFEIVEMEQVVPVDPSVDDALAALADA
jgi:anti-anti-sigma factor